MPDRTPTAQLVLEGLRRFRDDLLRRIEFLSGGRAQVRIRHEQGWVDASDEVVTNLYRQLGEIGALIHELAAPACDRRHDEG